MAAGGGALALHHHLKKKKEVDGEKVARVHRAVKQLRRAIELVGDGSVAYHAGSAEGVANSARMQELVPGPRQAYGKGVYFQVGSPNQKYGPAAVALRGEKADNLLRQLPREDALPSAWRISPGVVPLGGKDVLVSHGEHPDGALGRAVVRSGARDGRLRHIDAAPWQQAVSGSTDSRAAVDAAKRTRRADIAADKSVAEARRAEALRYKKLVEESEARLSRMNPAAASPPAVQAKTASTDIDILKYAFQGETTSDGPGVASRAAAPAVGDKVAFKLQGHTEHQGIPIAIENRKGSVRKGVDKDGKPWRTVMKMPYGYIKGSKGADGEEIDCYVGPDKDAPNAYVVHQRKADGTGYDEDKVLLGMKDKEEAKKKYLQHYNSDKFLGPVKEVPVERLKKMLSEGKKLEKISRLCGRLFRRG